MSELDLGAGRQSTDSLPVGPFPVHSKRGFVGAGFCCAGQQCGGFSGLVPTKTLHIGGHFTVSTEELGFGLFRYMVVSFSFGGHTFALRAEVSASFSGGCFFAFSIIPHLMWGLSETLLLVRQWEDMLL